MERRASSPVHAYSREAKNFPCDLRETSVSSVVKIWLFPKDYRSTQLPESLCDTLFPHEPKNPGFCHV